MNVTHQRINQGSPVGQRLAVRGIALVITLLMLSVITFLAVAFLVVTRRDTSATRASRDAGAAKAMSEAALARAQAEIIARMAGQEDILAYDYMASSNFNNPAGFQPEAPPYYFNPINVNYDLLSNGFGNVIPFADSSGAYRAEIANNLWYDPRPPVYVATNTDPSRPAMDFRYYVDLNRNGSFEGSSYRMASFGDLPANRPVFPMNANGEPEWIGVLADPTVHHSPNNQFIGRYAYLVLPIGKTLDLNFIGNQDKQFGPGWIGLNRDAYGRDQGVGSWELNLGAYLRDLNVNSYVLRATNLYNYPLIVGSSTLPNIGDCFDDSSAIVNYRYGPNWGQQIGLGLANLFANYAIFQNDGIDNYGAIATGAPGFPFDFVTGTNDNTDPDRNGGIVQDGQDRWPGSYNPNMFYDMQEVFDPTKTGQGFTNRMAFAGGLYGWANGTSTNSIIYDRYTFQRMLGSIGTGSDPEYSTYVYPDGFSSVAGAPPTLLRTKMNLDYDNQSQMAAGPYSPMPTNLTVWADPVKFFTNAADLLLRTQEFPVLTNVVLNNGLFDHFGLGSMYPYYPIYNPTNSSYRYTPQLHRMLQLAANLCASTVATETAFTNTITFTPPGQNAVFFPPVFRPLFYQSNSFLFIVGYTNVPANQADAQLGRPWHFMTDSGINPNDNVYGIPWVVGAVKGLPSFNGMSVDTCFGMTRKLQFVRPGVTSPPTMTNQLYELSLSNHFAISAWNSYHTPFNRPVEIRATNIMSLQFTNTAAPFPSLLFKTNIGTYLPITSWPAWDNSNSNASMIDPLALDVVIFPQAKFLDTANPPNLYAISNTLVPANDVNRYTVHQWSMNLTNTLTYVMQDQATRAVLDFVNFGSFDLSTNFIGEISNKVGNYLAAPGLGITTYPPWYYVWNSANANESASSPPSVGLLDQILIGEGNNPRYSAQGFASSNSDFFNFMTARPGPTNLVMSDPFEPTVFLVDRFVWAANDPLVHYTSEDMAETHYDHTPYTPTSIAYLPLAAAAQDTTGSISPLYTPWPSQANSALASMQGSGTTGIMALNDPQITQSDDWEFPTNRFPNVGWIGRIHRGTPWQTVYLKADLDPTGNDVNLWVTRSKVNRFNLIASNIVMAAYPTNDWGLLDLFTTAADDNAMRGTLSVNQTNSAAWHALLDGVVVLTNVNGNISGPVTGSTIDPNFSYGVYPNVVSYILDSSNIVNGVTNGVNWLRAKQPNGLFHHIGDVLQAPTLTVTSPFVNYTASPRNMPRDELVERIPQQVGSLLKLGEPQFVIYSWGQSLRPANLYNGGTITAGQSNLFKICTNYSISGEYLTRTVCHIDLTRSDRFGQHPKLVIDNFNILPAAQ